MLRERSTAPQICNTKIVNKKICDNLIVQFVKFLSKNRLTQQYCLQLSIRLHQWDTVILYIFCSSSVDMNAMFCWLSDNLCRWFLGDVFLHISEVRCTNCSGDVIFFWPGASSFYANMRSFATWWHLTKYPIWRACTAHYIWPRSRGCL